jgi:hypothetical protein
MKNACRFQSDRICTQCGWRFPYICQGPIYCECPHPSTKEPKARSEPKETTIARMRDSIDVLVEISTVQLADRLAKCQACDQLSGNGCMAINCGCGERWGKWRAKVIAGECGRFR